MRRNRSIRAWPWLAVGIGIGWLTAPRRGSSVRARIRQKAWHWSRMALRYAGRRGRDWRNRLAGTAVELRRATRPEPAVAPVTLAARVRSRLGRQFYLGQVEITADGGVIHLSGRMPSNGERERLIAAVRGVEGVHEVTAEHLRAA
jgi:osmotically-inducible protein OsmY